MTTVIIRPPSFTRYRRYFWRSKGKSILRCLEYERLSQLGLTGRVLDFGGGSKSNYFNEIMNWGDPDQGYVYESANIDHKIEPTYILDNNGKIPIDDGSFDTVISLNTFEHVDDLTGAFSEVYRVLKPAGRLIFIVPFIFRVHGHPNDYLRGTPSFWNKILKVHDFEEIVIESMNWGPFSTALTVSGSLGPFKILRRNLSLLIDVIYFALRQRQGVALRAEQDAPICNAPLGYFICANKC